MKARVLALALVSALLLAAGCSVAPSTLRHDPYPFTPAPARETTPIDGWYTREVPSKALGGSAPCIRCPPYKLALGSDIVGFNEGTFRVYHWSSGYVAVGNYTTDGSTVTLFNDSWCPTTRGAYRMDHAGDTALFRVLDDSCAFDAVRTRYFEVTPWRELSPPEGVYLSNEQGELMIMDGRFLMKDGGTSLSGTYTLSGSTITVTAGDCRQRFRWAERDGVIHLLARGHGSCDLPVSWYSAT